LFVLYVSWVDGTDCNNRGCVIMDAFSFRSEKAHGWIAPELPQITRVLCSGALAVLERALRVPKRLKKPLHCS